MLHVALWLLAGAFLVSAWAWAFYGDQAAAGECFGVAIACAGAALMVE